MEAWRIIMSRRLFLREVAFRIRDAIAARFGVKRIGGFTSGFPDEVHPGDMLDFFRVEYVDDAAMTLTERDRHLDVMTCVSVEGARLTITSSVVTHNLFGRIYMIPVGPAHQVIVRNMLNYLAREVASGR